jgi:hypothetical protein
MPTMNYRAILLMAGTLLTASACQANSTVPPTSPQIGGVPIMNSAVPEDSTSILKKLTKDIKIGSTIDPKNGDNGPRAISLVRSTFGLKAGQLLVCNFVNKAGDVGKGSTIEVLNPKANSKPATFAQNTALTGCDGDAITESNTVYASGLTFGKASQFDNTGKLKGTYGNPISAPLADADAYCGEPYAPEDVYVTDSKTGAVVKMEFYEVSGGVKVTLTEVISGFGVNKGTGWGILGPSGVQYNSTRTGPLCNDTLYLVDGATNTVVAVSNASNLTHKDEIQVQPGGKTFKCLHPSSTCATIVHSGSPLNAPVASALLPNGNLIVANTKGGNTLVEMTPTGKILDTKKIDNNSTADIFGLLATGTSDSNTVLYYTDTATNTLQELQQ